MPVSFRPLIALLVFFVFTACLPLQLRWSLVCGAGTRAVCCLKGCDAHQSVTEAVITCVFSSASATLSASVRRLSDRPAARPQASGPGLGHHLTTAVLQPHPRLALVASRRHQETFYMLLSMLSRNPRPPLLSFSAVHTSLLMQTHTARAAPGPRADEQAPHEAHSCQTILQPSTNAAWCSRAPNHP